MIAPSILIADDDVKLLVALRVRFESEGYQVIVAQDAYQALERAGRDVPDLLLLDINMPAGNGFSVQERVAKMEHLANVPVVYITGENPGEVDRTARSLGAAAIVHKPFDTDALLETVRTVIAERAVSAAAGS